MSRQSTSARSLRPEAIAEAFQVGSRPNAVLPMAQRLGGRPVGYPAMIAARRYVPLRWVRRPWTTVACVVWLSALAVAYLAPALSHGGSLGGFDFLGQFGIGKNVGSIYNPVSDDQIQQMAPWTALDWVDIHAGHLPLWNPYSGLGMPLAFNFQAAPFALPTLVGYLAPLHYAYTTAVLFKLILAGTGALYLCRKLGLSNLSAVFAGTIFELSGSFTGWLGWPQATVISLLGWVLGATVVILERDGVWPKARSTTFLAVVLAFVMYAGHPESVVFVVGCMAAVVVVYMVSRVHRMPGRMRLAFSPLLDLALAGVAALALAAPLLLPGIPILSSSARQLNAGYTGLPRTYLINLVAPGYFGFPTTGSTSYGSANYYEAASYVGSITVILALFAALCLWRRRSAISFGLIGVTMLAILFVPPVAQEFGRLPILKEVQWTRVAMPLALALAVLAAMGMETLRLTGFSPKSLRRLWMSTGAFAFVIVIWWFGRRSAPTMPAGQRSAETQAFIAPVVGVATVLLVLVGIAIVRSRSAESSRPRRPLPAHFLEIACALLLVVETGFLLTATPNLWPSSNEFFATSAAELHLQQKVGNARVGDGACTSLTLLPADIGILPDDNVIYKVSQLAVYDPAIPQRYFQFWSKLTGTPVAHTSLGQFCPTLSSGRLAREFGTSYVLEPDNAPPATGMQLVGHVGNEYLLRVPGGGVATLERRDQPANSASAEVVPISYPNPSSISLHTASDSPSTLYLHITDDPGWHVLVDGHPAPLRQWNGLMMEVALPAGRHVVTFNYRPTSFDVGVVCASAALVALCGWIAYEVFDARRHRTVERTSGSAA